jgi:type II secretory pathway predicted ATPase ExeA
MIMNEKTLVLIVDEAQTLKAGLLEFLRQLLNLEFR